MSIRCRFGIHRWPAWQWTATHRELMPGYWQTGQVRRCKRCGYADSRWAR